jgi:hypothetical protein
LLNFELEKTIYTPSDEKLKNTKFLMKGISSDSNQESASFQDDHTMLNDD